MITISFEGKSLNGGVPLYRRPILHYSRHMFVDIDNAGMYSPFEQAVMRDFKRRLETSRFLIDVVGYNGAGRGMRYAKGNSTVSTETHFGAIAGICLSYADIENCFSEQSPSNLTTSRLGEIARHLKRQVPNLVILDDSVLGLSKPAPFYDRPGYSKEGQVQPFNPSPV